MDSCLKITMHLYSIVHEGFYIMMSRGEISKRKGNRYNVYTHLLRMNRMEMEASKQKSSNNAMNMHIPIPWGIRFKKKKKKKKR